MIAPGVPGGTGLPLFQSIGTSSMPGATRNGVGGASLSASFMKSRKIGAPRWRPARADPGCGIVEADIDAGGEIGRKADEPDGLGVLEVPVLPPAAWDLRPTE
jgi:hypothetical protein